MTARIAAVALTLAAGVIVGIWPPGAAQAGEAASREAAATAACNRMVLASDARRASSAEVGALKAEALNSRKVAVLKAHLRTQGYVPLDSAAYGVASSRGDVVFLPLSSPLGASQGAVVAYTKSADGTVTVESATLRQQGTRVVTGEQFRVVDGSVTRARGFIDCMIACLAVRCSAIYRCPTIFGPGVFLACAAAVCGSRVPGCVRLCR